MSGPETDYRAWVAKAEHDLLNIENNLVAVRVPWDTICFHAQQAAEKLLKAFLVYHGQAAPHIHDLVALLRACAQIDESLGDLQADCAGLTDYAVVSRYPTDEVYEPGEDAGRAAAAAARRVHLAVLARLPQPGQP